MKNLFTLLFVVSCANISYCQAPVVSWEKALGGTGVDQASCVAPTSDGGYIVGGRSQSNDGNVSGNHGSSDYWLTKLNSTGSVEWEKSLGGSGDDRNTSVQQTSDGGYIVAGYSNSIDGDVTGNHGGYDFWVIKLDNTGAITWQKSYGGTGDDLANSIIQTSDGGYIVAGYTTSLDGDISGYHGGTADYWILKISNSGVAQWKKCFGGSSDDRAYAIRQSSDGSYVVCGYTNSNNNDVTGNHGSYDYWIVKLDNAGTIQWEKSAGGTLDDRAYSIESTTDGGFIVAGYAYSLNGDASFNNGSSDYWIVKLDNTGSITWQKSLGGSTADIAYSIIETSDNGYIAAGYTSSSNGDVSNNHGATDYWMVKLDSVGNVNWEKTIGGSSSDYAYCLKATADSGLVVAGYSSSNDQDITGNHGSSDYWVVKLNYTTLPLTLLSFNAEEKEHKSVILSWSTSNEINNDFFTIEKNIEGTNFTSIGVVDAYPKAQIINHYSFTDNHISAGISYYRLVQTDFDGRKTFSNVVPVKITTTDGATIKPNPSPTGKFTVDLGEIKTKLQVIVTDLSGRKIFSQYLSASRFLNITLTDKKGSYFLQAFYDGGHANAQLIVQ